MALPWFSLNSSSEGWKQRARWHMTSGISALGFLFFLSCLPRNAGQAGWRKSDGDEAQGASCYLPVPSLLNRKLERAC